MRKIILTLGLLIWGIYLVAQFDPASYERTSNYHEQTRSASWEQNISAQRNIERDINLLIEEYPQLSSEAQVQSERRIIFLLHELLDLKITEKEREVEQLDKELKLMQQSDLYQKKQVEIHSLQESLLKVKQNLEYRKRHKSEIVRNRLAQLLGTN